MRYLLDTHVLIWALSSPGKLPKDLRTELEDPANDVFASAASTWEIAIKGALGKIQANVEKVIDSCRSSDLEELPVRMSHTARVSALPRHHHDPFDRLLIAQALEEGLTIATRDDAFEAYGVPVRWREESGGLGPG